MTIAALEALTFGLGRLVDAADRAGQRLCLLTGNRDIYRHELSRLDPGALDVVDVDTHDMAACAAELERLPGLDGLINSTDTWLLPGAELAARFGLAGPDPEAARTIRDKRAVRVLMHRHGLSRGTAIAVPDGSSAAELVRREVGLPAALKDSAGTSSRNVWLAHDEDQLRSAVEEAADQKLFGRLLAEPFFAGPLYSAETLTWAGRTRLLGVHSRQLSRQQHVREEAAGFPVAFPDADRAELEQWVSRVLAVAGHRGGFAHVEFVLTAEGPELVEINGRIGGAMVGEALCRSLGTNVYEAMVDMALGKEPELLGATTGSGPAVAFVLVYPDRAGTFTGMAGIERLTGFPGSPEWYPTMTIGNRIESLGDQRACTGIVLAEAATAELALHRALSAAGGVHPVVTGR
ncbi:ATP-grasp domain-containing protein [Saccharopolyspora elongata]|uniref:ATP-grasp domain-containing protein n=1 Tax=Saccharopolyspora elongata TaxID=2530387 RepID=A0A4V2YJS4_9PSEU|nr:ATP-grasp domain-containing protein [Saccharopolyspora elongata]TDD39567.1 ATP-grasp domain-containing protein [Saccharopolyspora elongata]